MTPEQIRAAIAASPDLQAHQAAGRINAIAAALSVGSTKVGTVSTAQFASWAGGTGMRAVIEDKAAATGDPLRSSALAMKDVLVGGASGIRLDHADNLQMLAAWVALGALTTPHRDSLIALAAVPDPVTDAEVEAALGGA